MRLQINDKKEVRNMKKTIGNFGGITIKAIGVLASIITIITVKVKH